MVVQKTYPDPCKLVQALRVIRTWADFDTTEQQRTALLPEDVVKLCDKALADWPGDGDE